MKTFFSSVKIFSPSFALLLKKCRPLTVFFLFCQPLAAKTLRVPEDFPRIQTAVDAAQTGDTVLVGPGVYFENVQLRGRDLVLTSRFALHHDWSLIEKTVIDGSRPLHPDTASCLLIWKGETAATVVQGFTFQGGTGTVWLDPAGYGTFREGGGILTEDASPVIRYNLIRYNVVGPRGGGMVSNGGGGIRCGAGAPRIECNRIVHNRGDGYGGGIVLNYCPGAVIRNNIIAFNVGGQDFSGGGFWSTGKDQSTRVVLHNNVIAYNQTPAARMKYGGNAGGVWTFSIHLQMVGNIIWGNSQALGDQTGQLGAEVEALYNCTQAPIPGTGNLAADPLFADTVWFTLSPGSPCVDAGQPDSLARDFSRNGRMAAFPGRGGLRNDIGAYGGSTGDGLFAVQTGIFSKITGDPVVNLPGDSRSVNWVDIDADGYPDLFISNGPKGGEDNLLYHNNGKGRFSAVLADPVVQDHMPSDGATWADYDNDGFPDCFVVNWYNANNLLYRNDGDGTFRQVTDGAPVTDGGYSETAAWGDYDNDGRLDLYVANSAGAKTNFLYRNMGDGRFKKITTGAPVTDAFSSRCVNWVDVDGDGDSDLFVSNEDGEHENLYRNDGNGQFTGMVAGELLSNGGNTMSACWGDYDNDGDPDVFLTNFDGQNALFQNDGMGVFTKVDNLPFDHIVGNTLGCQWADVDNDGYLDLFVTCAFGKKIWHNALFFNNGDGTFRRDTVEAPVLDEGWSYGCAFGDLDRDGDLDLAVANCFNALQTNALYENHAAEGPNHWLVVNCIGTQSNRSAIGAVLCAKAEIRGQSVTLSREISAQSGYCGQNQLPAHFGLGSAAGVHSLEVRWPSGLTEWYAEVAADRYWTLSEGKGLTTDAGHEATSPVLTLLVRDSASGAIRISGAVNRSQRFGVEIVNSAGRTVWRSAARSHAPGVYALDWDGKLKNRKEAPAGMYTAVIRTNEMTFRHRFQKTVPGK